MTSANKCESLMKVSTKSNRLLMSLIEVIGQPTLES